jgi:hypothetical protein
MNNPKKPSYEVGYGKPPKQTQFKQGVSGNPKGRATRASTARDTFTRVFNKPVTVSLSGQQQRMPGLEAIFLQMRNQIMKGNLGALRAYINLGQKFGIFDKSDEVDPQLQGLFDALKKGPVD